MRAVQTRAEVLSAISAHRAELQELGVAELWIFGSAARDDLGPDSDVDVLVELARPLGLEFFEIGFALEGWLGRRADVGTPRSLHPRAQAQALREAIRAA
ncbi:MAG: nucleotidyltransferase family protein [Deinococcus sp.]